MFQRKADVMRVYQHLTQVFQRRKVIFSCGINFGISVVVGEVCFLQILQVDAQLVDLIHHIRQRHFGGILAVVSAGTGQLSAGRVPQSYRAIAPLHILAAFQLQSIQRFVLVRIQNSDVGRRLHAKQLLYVHAVVHLSIAAPASASGISTAAKKRHNKIAPPAMSGRAVLPDAVIMLGRCFWYIQLLLRLFRATFTYLMHGFFKNGYSGTY